MGEVAVGEGHDGTLGGMETLTVIDRGVTYQIEAIEEGGYFGQVVGLEACFTDGLTLDETISNIREALSLYLEVAEEHGLPVPEEIRDAVLQARLSA